MSNQSYEKLHKLVTFVLHSGLLTIEETASVLGVSFLEFLEEFPEHDFDSESLAINVIEEPYNACFTETCSRCTCNDKLPSNGEDE